MIDPGMLLVMLFISAILIKVWIDDMRNNDGKW